MHIRLHYISSSVRVMHVAFALLLGISHTRSNTHTYIHLHTAKHSHTHTHNLDLYSNLRRRLQLKTLYVSSRPRASCEFALLCLCVCYVHSVIQCTIAQLNSGGIPSRKTIEYEYVVRRQTVGNAPAIPRIQTHHTHAIKFVFCIRECEMLTTFDQSEGITTTTYFEHSNLFVRVWLYCTFSGQWKQNRYHMCNHIDYRQYSEEISVFA